MADKGAFVPAGFDPPPGLATGELRLEPLGPQHNERDYAAWTSSMDHIRRLPRLRRPQLAAHDEPG